jgi:hypothetical protein
MVETEAIAALPGALDQPERGLYFAPIRHHSPACAFAVRALIRDVRPKRVLIEAPADFAPHIPLIAHAETKPPVAIAALIGEGDDLRVAAYYPFCVHAPEYVALVEAIALGAEIRFIDLPAADKVMRRSDDDNAAPVSLCDETAFNSGDFIRALCRRTGARDGYELWDHLFETRLGDQNWRGLLADVGAYCAGMRASTAPAVIEHRGDTAREAQMGAAILAALDEGEPVVVVTGGFHTPALIERVASNDRAQPKGTRGNSRSFLIRYSFAALDALSGYASGLPQPAYYDFLWRRAEEGAGALAWKQTALDLASGFARKMRADGHAIAVPQQVEMVRAAETLALLRGRPGALRHDLLDAARTALVKGEAGRRDIWTERLLLYLRGDAIGDVPASAGSPPLVEHARALARAHRLNIGDGASRRRRLDIRRKAAHLAASRYLHAMTLLGTGFADRELGPDYFGTVQTENLFEEWSYAWSPNVEARLIELAAQADRIDAACMAVLLAKRDALKSAGAGSDVAAITDLIGLGLLVGLGRGLLPLVSDLGADIQAHADFSAVAQALRTLTYLSNTGSPVRAPPELELIRAAISAYHRLVFLCDDLPDTHPDAASARVDALRMMAELLNADVAAAFDRNLFDEAIDRVADANPPAEILGAVLAICVQSGRRNADDLRAAMNGAFGGSALRGEDRIGVLRGMLHTAPQLLWRTPGVLETIDAFLGGLDETAFTALLPHLRLAFSALNPREIDQVAASLAALHGGQPSAFAAVHYSLTPGDLDLALAVDRKFREAAARDGLSAWLFGGENP